MVYINRSCTSVSYMINNNLNILKIYEEKLEDGGSKITHRNWCGVFYGSGKYMLSRIYFKEYRECVYPDVSGKYKIQMRFSDNKCMEFGK